MLQRREWKLKTADTLLSESELSELARETGFSPVTVRACVSRGLITKELILSYFQPKMENMTAPLSIAGLSDGVDRVLDAFVHEEKIRVFSDYDVDGTCGAALLTWVFRDFGFSSFDVKQPDRFKDGYGLNTRAIEEAAADGVKVLITVDCGITSFEQAERALELGIDLIIIDHHQLDPVRGLPSAFSVINPQRPDCESGLKQLCGCGLAFYFSVALRRAASDAGLFEDGKLPNLKKHLDLVVIATAADMVPLIGDNRILVKQGMEVLKRTEKPGLKALLEAANVKLESLSASHLGFTLGPRINASGRMSHAQLAYECLTTRDAAQATVMAKEIESLNAARMQTQNEIWDVVRLEIEEGLALGKFKSAIVVGSKDFHEGVVGIVASRITEHFHKPAVVVAFTEHFGKGSVRSFAGKNVLEALRTCAPLLRTFGGHHFAAGLSLMPEQFEEFVTKFDEVVGMLPEQRARELLVEGECELRDLDEKTLNEFEKMAPFGVGNPEPIFQVKARVEKIFVMKERHLKLTFDQGWEGVWFNAVEKIDEDLMHNTYEWVGVPEMNRFRGKVTPTLRMMDARSL